jgi:hypothetical protein
MKTEHQQSQSEEPRCCAICFTEPASPLNVGQSQSQQMEDENNKENHNDHHASVTTVNHASGFAYLPCCGGAQGQREATTTTKICTSCIMTLCQQSRKLEEAASSFRVNNVNVNADQIMFNVNGNAPTTPTTSTATAAAETSMLVSPETSNSPLPSSFSNHESCTIHCPRCRHRVSVSESNGNGDVYITSTARSKAQPNVHVQTCPIMPTSISTSMSMRNDEDLVHVLNPFNSSSSSARLELPRRARAPRAPLVPLEAAQHAPRNGRRERPSMALRRQRHQLFRQSPLRSPTFHRMMRQESVASSTSNSVEEEQEPQQAIVRTLSFWQ